MEGGMKNSFKRIQIQRMKFAPGLKSHKWNQMNKFGSNLGRFECAQRILTYLDTVKVWKRSIENHCVAVPKQGRAQSYLLKARTV